MEIKEKFPGAYLLDGRLSTKNLSPGKKVYGEQLIKTDSGEYRIWDLHRSKIAGAIRNGLAEFPIKPGCAVLYLGAASGTTASHVSDIVGAEGGVFCVEFAQRSMRDLIAVCESRSNMLPIFGDARKPDTYAKEIGGTVDVLYEDVAQPDQARILVENSKLFLKSGGHAMIAIKSQSIDVTLPKEKVFKQVILELSPEFEVLQQVALEPYDLEHLFLHLKKK
jgi:fibrillarin-like pre-rRNA processing protein